MQVTLHYERHKTFPLIKAADLEDLPAGTLIESTGGVDLFIILKHWDSKLARDVTTASFISNGRISSCAALDIPLPARVARGATLQIVQ